MHVVPAIQVGVEDEKPLLVLVRQVDLESKETNLAHTQSGYQSGSSGEGS